MPRHELTLRARYVFPVDAPPIESGSVQIAGDRIVGVGPAGSHADVDLGNAAILPGLVNAHTHLEMSALRAKTFAGTDFVNWLRAVITSRGEQKATQIAHAVGRGIDASLAAGTTLLGDISTSGRSWKPLLRSPLRAVVFAELIGLKPQRAKETAEAARQFLQWADPAEDAANPETAAAEEHSNAAVTWTDGTQVDPLPPPAAAIARRRLTPSLSPHAPYSTHTLLYNLAARWARTIETPICSHLAETREELRLLRDRTGPLREFLFGLGAWDESALQPPGANPTDYLEGPEVQGAHWLIAHGNYLTDDEITRLARQSATTSRRRAVVYCPRTHAYFGHERHPFAKMLAAGLTVCLGTDSLASAPSLSVLDEMRFLHRREPAIDTATVLNMGTLAGARALGREVDCGSLTVGKLADLAVVRLPQRDDSEPHNLLLDSDEPVVRTMIGGRFVYQGRSVGERPV